MAAYLIDEDLPRSLAQYLRAAGVDAVDVRDVRLGGEPDDRILEFARRGQRLVVTRDVSFASRLLRTSGTAVVLVRFPSAVTVALLNQAVISAITSLGDEDLAEAVVVIEPGRLRLRRSPRGSVGP